MSRLSEKGFVTHELLLTIGIFAFGLAISLPTLRAMEVHGVPFTYALAALVGIWLVFAATWLLFRKAGRRRMKSLARREQRGGRQ